MCRHLAAYSEASAVWVIGGVVFSAMILMNRAIIDLDSRDLY